MPKTPKPICINCGCEVVTDPETRNIDWKCTGVTRKIYCHTIPELCVLALKAERDELLAAVPAQGRVMGWGDYSPDEPEVGQAAYAQALLYTLVRVMRERLSVATVLWLLTGKTRELISQLVEAEESDYDPGN